ncbi:MAG: DUF11 domain-containing protein [Wenzhouxiangella sp.]|nr:MAG: DUF11 domain-containing protein [Wenzhouxiangella sp.]
MNPLVLVRGVILFLLATMLAHSVRAQNVDLVVNVVSDQPAYMSLDVQSFAVTISNNGPDTAGNVVLVVEHPIADEPFEETATCQPLAGPNPNGPAVCSAGSGTAPSAAFVRSGQTFSVTLPSIPSQSEAVIEFSTQVRCPDSSAGPVSDEVICRGVPSGNFPISATVSADQNDLNPQTGSSVTNVFLFPPDVQYRVAVTDFPATASPGDIVEYEFEVESFGLHPSDLLELTVTIKGEAGDMTPLTFGNHPAGPEGSTLPATELLSIDCTSATLGAYPPASVFPSPPAIWQTCPSSGIIPIPIPTSVTNEQPVTGFPGVAFLENLPGTLDGPATGGVMRFTAQVQVGEPVCVTEPETGVRNLVFEFRVGGLDGTDLVPPGPADNVATVITEVAGNCEAADIAFETAPVPATLALDGNGEASWVHEVTVSNLSVGPGAGTATNVPVEFEHHSLPFAKTHGTLTCAASVPGLCPTATELNDGIVASTSSSFQFAGLIASLPPGESITLSLPVSISRTACWGSSTARINLSGQAGPSPALFDPVYSPLSPPMPAPFTPGVNSFFGNNGMQTVAEVSGLPTCPGGGGPLTRLEVEKFGPFASANDAQADTGLIGQTSTSFINDGTEVFYRIEVRNPDSQNAVMLGDIEDISFTQVGLDLSVASGFVGNGSTPADWGISCVPSPTTATCHELAGSPVSSGYNWLLTLSYDPALHGGQSEVELPPGGSLTYIVPFTMPTHLNQCHGPTLTTNRAFARFVNAVGNVVTTPQSIVDQYIGMPPCTPGELAVEKQLLAPATQDSIPLNGQVSWSIVLSNESTTETLDIPRLIDQTFAFSVDATIISVDCTPLSGAAQCPATPVIPGIQTTASGATSALPSDLLIDHEWGSVGNNTFPPLSSVEFVVTVQLANPGRMFSCISNSASFNGINDPNGWVPDQDSAFSCPPPGPELSLQKQVTPQIAQAGQVVTYTLTVTNIGTASADGAVLTDPMPAALAAANPGGFSNVSCTDLSNSPFIPNPQGVAVCPPVTSNASGLSATIATMGPNTALQFSYQAVMPEATVSADNLATVAAPSATGLSFGSGTAQSQQNVQVLGSPPEPPPPPPPQTVVPVPVLDWYGLLALMLLMLAAGTFQARRQR